VQKFSLRGCSRNHDCRRDIEKSFSLVFCKNGCLPPRLEDVSQVSNPEGGLLGSTGHTERQLWWDRRPRSTLYSAGRKIAACFRRPATEDLCARKSEQVTGRRLMLHFRITRPSWTGCRFGSEIERLMTPVFINVLVILTGQLLPPQVFS
jgi:hypothetical protein